MQPFKNISFSRLRIFLIALGLMAGGLGGPQTYSVDTERDRGEAFFEQKIRPILIQNCYSCHSPEGSKVREKEVKGGLRLDVSIEKNPRLVKPGSPEKSRLLEALRYKNSDLQMPPKGKLPERIIAHFESWIQMGAPDPRPAEPSKSKIEQVSELEVLKRAKNHWAFNPIKDPTPPAVQSSGWVQSPIDRFILSKLEQNQLPAAPRADACTLIRRVYLDLIGLLPDPITVQSFEREFKHDPAAFSKIVDRLLSSPAYGERWGRHWLDVVRYGDCNGADESRAFPHAYHFRNYVIDAFNLDKPFDQLLTEHLAGDLIDKEKSLSDYDPLIGTGFLVLGTKILAERDPDKMFADLVDEQIDTVGRAFMGLTLGCARCHDHKFDPVPTKDYYSLAGIFRSTRTMASVGQWLERPSFTPESREQFITWEQGKGKEFLNLQKERNALQVKIEGLKSSPGVQEIEAEAFSRTNAIVDRDNYGKGIGIVSDPGSQKNFIEYDFEFEKGGEYLIQFRYAALRSRPVKMLLNGKVINEKAIAQVTGSWMPEGQRWFTEGKGVFNLGKNLLRLENDGNLSHMDKLRLIHTETGKVYLDLLKRSDQLQFQVTQLEKEKPRSVEVMAVEEGEIKNERIHLRGSHLQLGEEAPRGFLRSISLRKSQKIQKDSSGRLELARWMSNPDHPLTSRVIVNRLWHWHMGKGLVSSVDNFGTRGESPSHPDLLDYLAKRCIESGWSLKAIHREILLSSTYQSAWLPHSKLTEVKDPENRLHWRFDRRRLEVETMRDTWLQMTGELDLALGQAPLVLKTYDLPAQEIEKNRQFYLNSKRRTIYLPVLRTNLFELLTLFDFANPDLPTGRRSLTTVPTQALYLLNDDSILKYSQTIAQKVEARLDGVKTRERVEHLFQRFYSRSPRNDEFDAIERFLARSQKSSTTESAKERVRQSWEALIQTLLISNEFTHID